MVEQVNASLDWSYDTSTSDHGDDSSHQAPPSTCLLRSTVWTWLPQSPAARLPHSPAASLAWRERWPGGPEKPGSENASSESLSYLAQIAAETIKKTTKDAHIHHHRERRGWSVIARVSREELVRFAEPLLAVRREVFRHMRAFSGIVPLRVREKTQGFSISIGSVYNSFHLCWDAAMTGTCCHGQSCHWEHPRNIRHLFVVVKLANKGASLQGGEEEQESQLLLYDLMRDSSGALNGHEPC